MKPKPWDRATEPLKLDAIEAEVRETGRLELLAYELLLPATPPVGAKGRPASSPTKAQREKHRDSVRGKHSAIIDKKNRNLFDSRKTERVVRTLVAELLTDLGAGRRIKQSYKGAPDPIYKRHYGREVLERAVEATNRLQRGRSEIEDNRQPDPDERIKNPRGTAIVLQDDLVRAWEELHNALIEADSPLSKGLEKELLVKVQEDLGFANLLVGHNKQKRVRQDKAEEFVAQRASVLYLLPASAIPRSTTDEVLDAEEYLIHVLTIAPKNSSQKEASQEEASRRKEADPIAFARALLVSNAIKAAATPDQARAHLKALTDAERFTLLEWAIGFGVRRSGVKWDDFKRAFRFRKFRSETGTLTPGGKEVSLDKIKHAKRGDDGYRRLLAWKRTRFLGELPPRIAGTRAKIAELTGHLECLSHAAMLLRSVRFKHRESGDFDEPLEEEVRATGDRLRAVVAVLRVWLHRKWLKAHPEVELNRTWFEAIRTFDRDKDSTKLVALLENQRIAIPRAAQGLLMDLCVRVRLVPSGKKLQR
jgi:hypothetical protein